MIDIFKGEDGVVSNTPIRVVYMHMLESPTVTNSAVKEGAIVNTTTLIGKVGSTGASTGAHLHLSMIINKGTSSSSIDVTNNPQMYYNNKTFTYTP